ncbi:hypothetical protein OV450_1401 [Actinobacteria bacterium OV450]|nr:hypothetical protein OV450_1401 [Actinobacteria bacterium OV450]
MFRETISHAGGTTEGIASEAHALLILRRAARRDCTIEATADGGAVITWTYRQLRGEQVVEHPREIRLAPQLPAGNALTDTTVRDLDLIVSSEARYGLGDHQERVILCGIWRIPQGATARLRARGLVTDDDGQVRLTLVTRLALLARAHRTHTTEPAGWSHPADLGLATAGLNKPGRRAGMVYSSGSAALCECGFSTHTGDRDEARRKAAQHRAAIAAEFVAGLDSSAATA